MAWRPCSRTKHLTKGFGDSVYISGTVSTLLQVALAGQGDGEEETLETTGDGGVGMGGAETTVRPRKRKGRHYDAKDDVILRLEALPPLEVKVSMSTCCVDTCPPQEAWCASRKAHFLNAMSERS